MGFMQTGKYRYLSAHPLRYN